MDTKMLVGSIRIDPHETDPPRDGPRERLVDAIRDCCAGRATQDELAERTGISQSTASNYLAGKSVPNPITLNLIEQACGRPAGWVVVRAGLVADIRTVPEAIAMAAELRNDNDRASLLDVYYGLVHPAERLAVHESPEGTEG
jgi:transcriptional regulator with XRE-family HTH domain